MKKIILSLILIIAIIVSNAQNHQAIAEKGSLDAGKLNIIHEHLLNDIKTGKVSGAVVLVVQNGKIVHYEATGSADIERGKAISKDNIFRLASMSKPITGVAILMLIDQGKISLNDPLSKYIPQFKNMSIAIANTDPGAKYTTVPAYREVTIKDLLTHSSGIGQGKISSAEIAKITPSAFVTLSEYIPKFASVPLEFQPGSLTGYSPKAGFEILGRVVEIVSGETFDKFLSKHLFMPLEMKNTSFAYSPKSLRERIPVMYKTTDKGLIRETSEQSLSLDSIYFSGAGGLVGTTEDYYHFAQMLGNGGTYKGKRILSREIINQMSSPQLPDTIKGISKGQSWGLSVRVISADNGSGAPLTKGCFGWSGAWGTHFWVDPVHKIVALYMTNLSNAGGSGAETARELERDVMAALKE